jgi:hypothetical protein
MNTECPTILATEARYLWVSMVETLRSDGFVRPSVFLWRYDPAAGMLKPSNIVIVDGVSADRVRQMGFAAAIRHAVKASGANAVLMGTDNWAFETPGIRRRFAKDPQEALGITVETEEGGRWLAMKPYHRVGTRIFIADEMSPLEPSAADGVMSGWWSPTPGPVNN